MYIPFNANPSIMECGLNRVRLLTYNFSSDNIIPKNSNLLCHSNICYERER